MPTDKQRTHIEAKKPSRTLDRDPSKDSRATKRNTLPKKESGDTKKPRDESKSRSVRPDQKRDNSRDQRDRSQRRDVGKNGTDSRTKEKSNRNEKIAPDKTRKTMSQPDTRTAEPTNRRSTRPNPKGDASKIKDRNPKEKSRMPQSVERGQHKQQKRNDISPKRMQRENRSRDGRKSSRTSVKKTPEEKVAVAPSKSTTQFVEDENNIPAQIETMEAESGVTAANNYEEQYEDDFEDYESDFESDEPEEKSDSEGDGTEAVELQPGIRSDVRRLSVSAVKNIEAGSTADFASTREKQNILLAMQAENENVAAFKQKSEQKELGLPVSRNKKGNSPDSGIETTPSPSPMMASSNNFINFASAKRRQSTQKAFSRTLLRKLQLIDNNRIAMHEMGFDVFDLPPVDYDVYIKNFGRSNTKQTYCQTGEDDLTEEIQTDELEFGKKWTQHPALGRWCSGSNEVKNLDAEELQLLIKSDSARLSKFIQTSGEVVVSLLEEEMSEADGGKKDREPKSDTLFNNDFTQLGTTPFREGCPVTFVQFSLDEPQLLITIHGSNAELSEDNLPDIGIICVWNVFQPLFPQKVLSAPSQPSCSCFNPGKAHLVFAGSIDGSLLMWDLRESANQHKRFFLGDQEIALRIPSYNTAEILKNEGHRSPIKTVRAAHISNEVLDDSLASDHSEQHLTFRVVSLEEYGVVKLWTAIEIFYADPAGSDTDLGLAPGSSVRLIPSQTINLNRFSGLELRTKQSDLRTFDVQFLPNDCNNLFITTDLNFVIHSDSHGGKIVPSFYKNDTDDVSEVRSLAFCSWSSPFCFLVACSDDTVRLHSVNKEKCVVAWSNAAQGEQIISVQWAGTQTSQFYVLDIASRVHVWDLSQNESNPIATKEFNQQRNALHFHVNDRGSEDHKVSQVAIAFDNGVVEIYQITLHHQTNFLERLLQII